MHKCLQFILPSGATGMAAQHGAARIATQLRNLHAEKRIPDYKISHEKHYKMNVWFKDEQSCTLLLLIWDNTNIFSKPTLVERPTKENPFYGK